MLKLWNEIKHKPDEKLFPDKSNYFKNVKEKEKKYKNIPEALLNYKYPQKAYLCDCGWTFSSKYDKKRMKHHNETCAARSHYGVVPAFDPLDTDDNDAYIKEFVGYKSRLKDGKCIFGLRNKWIEYTDDSGNDIIAAIICDIGRGIVLSLFAKR